MLYSCCVACYRCTVLLSACLFWCAFVFVCAVLLLLVFVLSVHASLWQLLLFLLCVLCCVTFNVRVLEVNSVRGRDWPIIKPVIDMQMKNCVVVFSGLVVAALMVCMFCFCLTVLVVCVVILSCCLWSCSGSVCLLVLVCFCFCVLLFCCLCQLFNFMIC